jgi:aminopeptidase N
MFQNFRSAGLGLCSGLLILLGTLSTAVAGFSPTPVAPVPSESPFTRQYVTQQFRLNESETKARLAFKSATIDPVKTPGMEQYDVTFYGLTMDLNPSAGILTGQTEVRATVVNGSLDVMELHLMNNMSVSAVTSGGQATGFSHGGNILAINLDRTYQTGEDIVAVIDYSGNPEGDYFGWDSFGGQDLIWSLSEPYGARHWWPCKDLNTDKADAVDLHVTVPDHLIVASNGTMTGATSPGPGLKTYHWEERYPIPTYLVSLAVHPFAVFGGTYSGLDGTVMPLEYYVVPSRLATAQSSYPVTVDMLEAFAGGFGEYPFINEKYGHAHFPWGGGMEHQTLTSLHYDAYSEFIISHELAHQWWGDMITCADFGHIWLNEGFATWSEAYWREINEGMDAYHEEMNNARYLGGGTVIVEDPQDFNGIFDYYLSYLKASWVPHMLRRVVGDGDFFAGLALYRQTYEFGSATTEQFRDIMETVSGQDLDQFFQQWIYEPYHPVYGYSYTLTPTETGKRLSLKIRQTQTNAGLFTMPIDIRGSSSLGNGVEFVVMNNQREQWYTLDVPASITSIEIDPDDWILCEKFFEGVSAVPGTTVAAARVTGNYPNPFNPSTTIDFELPSAQRVVVAVYDLAGRRVATLVDGFQEAGQHQAVWNGLDDSGARAASGVFLVRMNAGGSTSLHKITMVQ